MKTRTLLDQEEARKVLLTEAINQVELLRDQRAQEWEMKSILAGALQEIGDEETQLMSRWAYLQEKRQRVQQSFDASFKTKADIIKQYTARMKELGTKVVSGWSS